MMKYLLLTIFITSAFGSPVKRNAADLYSAAMRQASEQAVDLIDKMMQELSVTKEQIEAGLQMSALINDRSQTVDQRVATFENMLKKYKLSDETMEMTVNEFRKGVELADYSADLFLNSNNERIIQWYNEMQKLGSSVDFYFGDRDQRVEEFYQAMMILQPEDAMQVAQLGMGVLNKCKEMGIQLPDSVNQMTTMMSNQIDIDGLKKLKL
ncbi:hypothetical protein WR25_20840 [Diploscapter pachys]|uniref:SXP/RAL-2 family protein Ani s 5-like cation-binding domain-containing protein n=1 Tax=Diploscapter pachys TaxID=2018661 RepID=A0A2A2JPC0_9BILA|nr:hypothetical protein WR25_20840 [Diploscapter pachys]